MGGQEDVSKLYQLYLEIAYEVVVLVVVISIGRTGGRE